MKLAKIGLWGGDPQKVLEARCDLVLTAVEHERFSNQYESAVIEMNRETKP